MAAPDDQPHRLRDLVRVPFKKGRLLWTDDPGEGGLIANQYFMSQLDAKLTRRDGTTRNYDLGSGLVTNVGVMAMAYDWNWATNSASLNLSTLALANNHATGTGVTGAATTDIACQTLASPTTTTAVAGAQSVTPVANAWTYKTVATINYTTTLAITEWGLHSFITLTAATGSPFTATSATSGTATATPFTASAAAQRGQQQMIVVPATTTVFGLILSNTTSVLTIPAWYTVAAGTAGSTPGATEVYALKPVLWDHKVFSAINVNNGDSIQFTYSLLINSGG